MDAALRAAQRRYDNMEPPAEPEAFLDTEAGQEWLAESADQLASGKNVTWKPFGRALQGVTYAQLKDALLGSDESDQAFQKYMDASLRNSDDDHTAEQLARSDLRAYARSVAIRLLAPLAESYAAHKLDEQLLDRDEARLDAMEI